MKKEHACCPRITLCGVKYNNLWAGAGPMPARWDDYHGNRSLGRQ